MNFQWAMDQLRENNRVRRSTWASETIAAGTKLPGGDGSDYVVPKDYTVVWHLFMMDGFLGKDFWRDGIINGWGGSIGGADDDDPVRDGMVYSATDADREADDWELHDLEKRKMARERLRPDGFPSRNDMSLMSPAELAILEATHAVEKAGASVALTDAVNLLAKARDRVADHVEGV